MMRRTLKTLAAVVPLLALILAAPAWAGGDKCRQDAAHAKATKAAAHDAADSQEKAAALRKAGWTGFEADRADDGSYRVTYVASGTPAAEAGVRAGDRLLAYQGIALTGGDDKALHAAKKGRKVGARVTYTLERDGDRRDVTLTLAEVPDTVIARWLNGESAQGESLASIDR